MSLPLKLDPNCIIKQGYLIKSPPMGEATIIRKRWHLRWFVLYDTQARADIDPAVEREVDLLYYKNDKKVTQGSPKGKISLIGAEVFKHRGRLHGYTYTINVQTYDRLYHLCATQVFVHNDWLEKIREHHIPNTEVPRNTLPRCQSNVSYTSCDLQTRRISLPSSERTYSAVSNSSVISNNSVASRGSVTSNSSVTSNRSDEYDYPYVNAASYSQRKISTLGRAKTCISTKNFDPTIWQSTSMQTCDKQCSLSTSVPICERPIPLPPGKDFQDDITYVGMRSYKVANILESEDEGYGRTDSDSSSISPHPSIITSRFNDLWNFRPKRNSLLEDFVGPRLSSSSSDKFNPLGKARSVGDLTLLSPLQRPEQRTTSFVADI